MRKALAIPATILLAASVAACGGSDDSTSGDVTSSAPTTEASTSATSSGELDVGMTEFAFQPADAVTEAGDVTIKASNDGDVVHELVILDTDADPADLPLAGGAVDESTAVGEIADVEPGATKSATMKLTPGTYAMVCALPGHYEGGMYGSLTVK